MAETIGTRIRVAREARDRFGHWVAPPSMDHHPCPHKCCRNYRPHPRGLPVRLDRAYLRSLSDEEVERELSTYQRFSDTHERGFLQVIAEATRREEAPARAAARKERKRARKQGQTADYRDHVYRQWLQAESATNGVMLNRAGRAAGIDERSLFSGPQSRVDRYASEELRDFFLTHRRVTRQEFDARQRAEDRAAREASRRAA